MLLNQTVSDPRRINGSAKVEGEARVALRDVGVEGLIAQPAHKIRRLSSCGPFFDYHHRSKTL